MKNAILLHGTCDKEEYYDTKYPSLSNSHWFPWLQKELLIRGITAQTPEMPDAYLPDYKKWKEEFERFLINENTLLIGHSCGGGFLVRWLSETNIRVGNVILVAPWLDPERVQTSDFFDFRIDPLIINKAKDLSVFISNNDDADIIKSLGILRKNIPNLNIREFVGRGHFTFEDMGILEFPELLNEAIKG